MTGQTITLNFTEQRKLAKQLIDAAPQGAICNIKEATRSSEQNAKMWAMLSDVARAKPEGRALRTDQWKCLFMDAVGAQRRSEKADSAPFEIQWEPGLNGGVVCLGYKSSRLAKRDFIDLIECIYAYGAEHGVRWSEPYQWEWREAA